jgi:hypothetical protein
MYRKGEIRYVPHAMTPIVNSMLIRGGIRELNVTLGWID